jgi:hypothetical protein
MKHAAQPAVGGVVLQATVPVLLHLDHRRLEGQFETVNLDVTGHGGGDIVGHGGDQVAVGQDGQQAHEVRQLKQHLAPVAFVLQPSISMPLWAGRSRPRFDASVVLGCDRVGGQADLKPLAHRPENCRQVVHAGVASG